MPINNGGGVGITVELDPNALQLTGGTLTGLVYVSEQGLRNPLNEDFIIDAYHDTGAGEHNYYHFSPAGSLDFFNNPETQRWGISPSIVYGEDYAGDNIWNMGYSGIQINSNGAYHLTQIGYVKGNKVTDADYRTVDLRFNDDTGFTLLHEKNLAPGATLANGITISAADGVKVNGSQVLTASNHGGYLTNYALKSGATFTGKVNINTGGSVSPLNLGITGTPTSYTIGDVWISGADMRFRDSAGATKILISAANSNAFTTYQSISSSNNSNPALKITQLGTGEALRVEDDTSPDATAFVVSNNGRVGIGVAPDATVALTVDSTGIKVNGMVIVPATTVTNSIYTGGQMSHTEYTKELIVTLGGVQYGIPLRVV